MKILLFVLNPTILSMATLVLAIIWMLRDDKDKTRSIFVIALGLNLVYSFLLQIVMMGENALVPWKYDHVLASLDRALGFPASTIAPSLQGGWQLPLNIIYRLMVPMMIAWYFAARKTDRSSIVLAYIAELLAGPPFYALLPACGPIYAFGVDWLHPHALDAGIIRLNGMPNAFPSLHLATAIVFMFFARGRLWRTVSIAMLAGTAMATLSTGEHYVIDLVAGVAFGCFVASAGYRRVRDAVFYFLVVLAWSLGIRWSYETLIAHPWLLRSLSALTLALGLFAVAREWGTSAAGAAAVPALRESGRDSNFGTSELSAN